MGDGPRSPMRHLDLYNLEEEEGRGSRYVLTSPRSLAACARLGVRPVELLHKPPDEFAEEHRGASMRLVSDMYEANERERRRRLLLCREERRRLLLETESKDWRARDKEKSPAWLGSTGEGVVLQRTGCPPAPTPSPDQWGPSEVTNQGWGSNRRGGRAPGKSRSLEDLSRHPEGEVKQSARRGQRAARVSVPEKDKKIAALMLAKHREEEAAKGRRRQAGQAWEGLASTEKSYRATLAKRAWADVSKSTEQVSAGKWGPVSCKEEWQDAAKEMEMVQQKWKRLSMEQKIRLKEGLRRARDEVESKKRWQEELSQEKAATDKAAREMDNHQLEERMLQAMKARLMKEVQNKKNIQVKNQHEKLRHSRLKQQVDSQAKEEELFMRMSIRHKQQKSQELYEQVIEERNKELKDKAAKEEDQILMAKIRAENRERELRKHREMLVQITDQKIKHARDSLEKSIQVKAERTRELNIIKEKAHQRLKQKVKEEENNHRREVEQLIRIKDRKSNQLLKDKEATVEESRRIARASFQMREKVREQTKCRSFDQMVLQAHLNASLIKKCPVSLRTY
ncbi:coiled-coil domain-containing protein 185 [Ascaphus truei]|uniref:coiled-coil domain-containing protein 185 n=1 Tax=Ascaphus truei TaxID=8439 RepID=UPI003F5A5B23